MKRLVSVLAAIVALDLVLIVSLSHLPEAVGLGGSDSEVG